ncbi:MAG: VCBS repeat-containing protein [Candidatus Omnitrophica bacterium]|nr:VCBS repeat-containing protein [Candidatus Omnitrophota bacterium]
MKRHFLTTAPAQPARLHRATSLVSAAALMVVQLHLLPPSEAASLGSATASAGSVPPPSVSAIQSFQPDLFTGRATTAIPLSVPPGRKGIQPALALAYSSSGRSGWLGVGWSLELGAIERSTKTGAPKFDATDTYTLQLQGIASELVKIPDGTYRLKDEGLFLRIENKASAGWEARDKAGTRYFFGQTSSSRIETPAAVAVHWALDKILDVNGNYLTITYTKDQNQLYPAQIRYAGHEPSLLSPTNQIDFSLEARDDVETSYRLGLPITTAKRLKTIDAKATVGQVMSLARRYLLAYTKSARTGRSLLASVTQIGADGVTGLPATTVTYSQDAPTYLHCHNCVPSISSGNRGWQIQTHAGNLFPADEAGNTQRLWPSGGWEPGVITWTEKVCHRRLFGKSCHDESKAASIAPVSWSSPQLQLVGSSNGISWSTDANGNLSMSGPREAHVLASAWLYSATPTSVTVSSLSASGHADVFYVPSGGSTWTAASGSVPVSGWTLIAVTAYDETGPFSLNVSANLATQVSAMNHEQFAPMSLSGDFNGDGLIDIAHLEPAADHWHVALNSPSGFGQERAWLSAALPAQTVPLVGDADADGRADLILWNSSSGQWQVARSTGTDFSAPATWQTGFGAGQTPLMGDFNGDQLLDVGTVASGTWQIALSSGSAFGSPSAWLSGFGSGAAPLTGDFNGDGLTDVAAASSGQVIVALSDGKQLVAQPSAWAGSFGAGQSITSADLNGDGLTDLVYYDKSDGTVVYAPSTGAGFGAAMRLMSEHPFGLRSADDAHQVGDFGGHGQSGFGVFNATSGQAEIAYALGTPPDLLTGLSNGLGGSTSLRYEPSTRFNQTFLPLITPLVTQASVADGMGNTYATSYRYSQGLYDAATREFRGFGKVEAIDPEGNVSGTEFHQDLHKKGRPFRSELRDAAGRLWTKTEQAWTCAEPYPGVHFTKLAQTDHFIYDGDESFLQTRARVTYDDTTGNVTRTDDDGDVAVTGDELATVTAYVANASPSVWILSSPSQVQTLDAAGTLVAQKRFSYDSAAWGSAPTKGLLTKEEEWLGGTTPRWLATSLAYDSYGNALTVTDAPGRVTTNAYDQTGTFPTRITNALGQGRSFTYDVRFGAVTTSTDPNGQTTTTEYDTLGRATKVIGPTDTAALPTIRTSYDLSTLPIKTTACARVQSGQAKELCTASFTDGLGRTIQTRSPSEDPTKQVVSGAVEFNPRGLVAKQWAAYLDAASSSYVPISLASGLTGPVGYTYDPLGRMSDTTEPDGAKTLVDYNDGETTTTLANGTQTQQTVDAHGRLVKVEEVISETERYTTTYAFDALGNLTQVTDERGNITRISYDSLGRKLSMDDPDMGRWIYTYDDVDNLKSQTDARGITIAFAYDALNRPTGKSYTIPAGSGITSPGAVTYSYDNPLKAYAKGALTEITDGSGSSSFEYDRLGRLLKESKTVDGTTYTIQRAYDLFGRLVSLTYPDGDVAGYTYNDQGGIETIALDSPVTGHQSLVTDMTYNAAGQLTKIAYGNGTVTDYSYDPQTLRLSSLRTSNSALQPLQDFSYAFDAVGNLTAITDRAHTASQTFQYDPLNRLTQASGSYGTVAYRYDPLGNLIEKEGQQLAYGAAGGITPHAVTSVADLNDPARTVSLQYDPNGNLIQKGSAVSSLLAQAFAYDAENRLTEVKSGQEQTASVTFQPGWNFFALPVIPDDGAVAVLLPSFAQEFGQIARFERPTDSFTHYVGNQKFDDFDRLEYGTGYQVYCKAPSPVTVSFKGRLPASGLSKTLPVGWHLIGSTSLASQATSTQFAGLDAAQILRYDTASRSLTATTQASPGEAYYVQARTSSTWSAPLPKDPSTRFVYDGDGGRVKLTTAAGTTTFLGQAYELDATGKKTKYVFAGSERIAAIETLAATAALPAPDAPRSWLASSWQGLQSLVAWLVSWPEAEAAIPPAQLAFYHPDHLGSTNLVTDGAGAIVELAEHAPFGEFSRQDLPAGQRSPVTDHAFTGQRRDASTALYFYQARYYDPHLGRFTQPDPLVPDPGDPQTLNRYAYVRNNPVNLVDPSGYKFWRTLFTAIGATVASVLLPEGAPIWLSIAAAGSGAAVGALAGATVERTLSRGDEPPSVASLSDGHPPAPPVFSGGLLLGSGGFGSPGLLTASTPPNWQAIDEGADGFLRLCLAASQLGCLARGAVGLARQASLRNLAAEEASHPLPRIPLGFKSVEQFDDAIAQFHAAAGVEDAGIGVRGSATTGFRYGTTTPFDAQSDIDVFIVSDQLYKQGVRAGAATRNGALPVGMTRRFFPALHRVEKTLAVMLNRPKVSIRIYSRAGYEAVKAATDIYSGQP